MSKFTINSLRAEDGTWADFKSDWENQCGQVGEAFDEYAPDSLGVLEGIANGDMQPVGAGSLTGVAGIRFEEDARYYAALMLNRAQLPNTHGLTLRVRHLLVSPLVDYGVVQPNMYAEVLIGAVSGVIKASESSFQANNVRFHMRSPADAAFFRAFAAALETAEIFESVQTRGSWLYITKA